MLLAIHLQTIAIPISLGRLQSMALLLVLWSQDMIIPTSKDLTGSGVGRVGLITIILC